MKCADESREELKKAAAIDPGSVREWLDEWINGVPIVDGVGWWRLTQSD